MEPGNEHRIQWEKLMPGVWVFAVMVLLLYVCRLAEHCLGQFPEDCDSNLRTAASGNSLSERERHALNLSIGQQKCLMALKKLLGNIQG